MSAELFSGKHLLLVCKETFSYPFYFLAQKWQKDNDVAAFFMNHVETKYAKSLLNDSTFYTFKALNGIKLYDTNEISDIFTENLHLNELLDEQFLNEISKKYTHFQNINCQIISSQYFTRHYHYRNYMKRCSYYQQLNWLILTYKNIISIIDDFKPDVVLDCDTAELPRIALREVCYSRNIPYINMDHPRYELYKIFSYNLGMQIPFVFKEIYKKYLDGDDNKLSDEIEYVREFKKKHAIMNEMFKDDLTSQYKPSSLYTMLKTLYGKFVYFREQDKAGNNCIIKKGNPILYPNSFEYLKFYCRCEIRKQQLMRKNKYFSPPIKGEKYVYMPLHLIPESGTFNLAPFYINELSIVEAVSKSLPAGWWLYVKEHQAMVGERGTDFYEKVNRLPNVRMVQLNYYNDPKPWIIYSQGVVTISGTTAYEAALLGKHAILFSDVPFVLINGIHRLKSYEDLPSTFEHFTNQVDNEKSCASYIATVKELGYPVNHKYLMSLGEEIIRGNAEMTDEYRENLNNLELLFVRGYKLYNEEMKLHAES